MVIETDETDEVTEFARLLGRYREALHEAVVSEATIRLSDTRLRKLWEAANAAELELSDYVRAALRAKAEP